MLKASCLISKYCIILLLFLFVAWPLGHMFLWLAETGYSFLLWLGRTIGYIANECVNFLVDVGTGIKNMFIGCKIFLVTQISESIEVIKMHVPNLNYIKQTGLFDEFFLGISLVTVTISWHRFYKSTVVPFEKWLFSIVSCLFAFLFLLMVKEILKHHGLILISNTSSIALYMLIFSIFECLFLALLNNAKEKKND